MSIRIRHQGKPPKRGVIQHIICNVIDFLEIIFLGMLYIFGMIIIFMSTGKNKEEKHNQ